jgi:chromosome segregation ATPase
MNNINAFNDVLTNVNQAIANLSKAYSTLHNEIQLFKNDIESLKVQVNKEDELSSIKTHISKVELMIQNMETKFNTLNESLEVSPSLTNQSNITLDHLHEMEKKLELMIQTNVTLDNLHEMENKLQLMIQNMETKFNTLNESPRDYVTLDTVQNMINNAFSSLLQEVTPSSTNQTNETLNNLNQIETNSLTIDVPLVQEENTVDPIEEPMTSVVTEPTPDTSNTSNTKRGRGRKKNDATKTKKSEL